MRLLREHDYDVVGSVGDGDRVVEEALRLRPDVIVTDISMPRLNGLEVLARLRAAHVESKVIILTMYNDAKLALAALRGGAVGFLVKQSAGEDLLAAIREVLQDRVYLTPALTREVMEGMAGSAGRRDSELTPRQLDVLRLIVKGRRMKQIAADLELSVRTVETHKYEIMRSLRLHSTAELVRYALDRRLVD